ncbi:hypothetical protein ACS0TY_035044 [Phlomoides rotata]
MTLLVLAKFATDFSKVQLRLCADEAELAKHVVGLTCSLASCQFRKRLTRLLVNANGSVIPKDCTYKKLIKKNLSTLVLSVNNLSGEVVDIHKLRDLQVIDLGNNNLGPLFPRIVSKLVSLVLRKNWFYSGVPDELSSCYQLQKMDINKEDGVLEEFEEYLEDIC